MNSVPTSIEGAHNLPKEPILMIPNRVNLQVLRELEQALGSLDKAEWLVVGNRPAEDICTYMRSQKNRPIAWALNNAPDANLTCIENAFAKGKHVVVLPARPAQPPAHESDLPARFLHHLLDSYPHKVLPIYAGMYNPSRPSVYTSQEPYDKLMLSILPPLAPGGDLAAELQATWLTTGARQAAQLLPEPGSWCSSTLPQALLQSLLAAPKAVIIDGVDDSRMTYAQLLSLAASLASELRRIVGQKRIGILLPPGKYAIIANVACLLGNIRPVNLDYHCDSDASFHRMRALAGFDRIITYRHFKLNKKNFPWPPKRDILYIDDALAANKISPFSGFGLSGLLNFINRKIVLSRVRKWIYAASASPEAEALSTFTTAADGTALRGSRLSHRAILAGAASYSSRFASQKGENVLSILPFYHRAGLFSGLIYPLLFRQNIITYPVENIERFCELISTYRPSRTLFTPTIARKILESADKESLSSLKYFHIIGETARQEPTPRAAAAADHSLYLCTLYQPEMCAQPIACNTAPEAGARYAHTSYSHNSAGLILPGVSIRISDIEYTENTLPPSEPGLLWVKTPSLFSGYLSPNGDTSGPDLNSWVCTGNVAYIRQDGLLCLCGLLSRFVKIDNHLVSLDDTESKVIEIMKLNEQPLPPRVAVVSVTDPNTGVCHIALATTLFKPDDLLILKYGFRNMHSNDYEVPSIIEPVASIPTLADGTTDYARCTRHVQYSHFKSRA